MLVIVFLSSDGFPKMNQNKWKLNFDCVDGLAIEKYSLLSHTYEEKERREDRSREWSTYRAYVLDVGPSGPNGVHVMIVWLVVLLSITVTASDMIADGVAHSMANTHMKSAVITVNGLV